MRGTSFHRGCPVPLSSLVMLTVRYWDFHGRIETGHLVVARRVARAVLEAFRRLYRARFPLARMVPVAFFGGSDARAMAADDTSGFNCRPVRGTRVLSEHARGEAIDLNPVENPSVRGSDVEPPAGARFVQRRSAPGVVVEGGPAWKAFRAIGWKWGGQWRAHRDYQHFSRTGM